ncbi:DUF1697 domain-containing protein [Sphingobacterium athyrii]|uniref:DUF1697 domain-containing protein n=1 Tax=Sphingobacterium athyrii TaxID=2152717 RepID=A0A363NSX8_9SPHI|nr:DUF1697 domain-containing protein [Sphingobacterium athyrii]PUV23857.1 hypothetical protein DCO56_10745 [Sphingobacterium athyrii]
MIKYCAFLRGVNVRGTNMKMADVCRVFKDTGMDHVSSVLASGNIVFSSDSPVDELKIVLEAAMSKSFSYDAFLFIKSEEEITLFRRNIPFDIRPDFHIYAFVGLPGVEELLMQEFNNSAKAADEKAKVINGVFYWQVPKGNTLDSTFGKILGKKSLKDKFTSRNVNTFEKILKIMQ